MRRVLAGILSGAVGLPVYLYFQNRVGMIAAGAVILGTYGLIDWLGLLPPPFEPDVRSLLHRGGESDQKRDTDKITTYLPDVFEDQDGP